MAIGRADAWNSPLIPVAVTGRPVVWNLRADPIWASGHVAAQQAGHMNAVDLQPISFAARLNPRGRPHMVLQATVVRKLNGHEQRIDDLEDEVGMLHPDEN
jgi:hypothetical protein